jgi:hypothetical protein
MKKIINIIIFIILCAVSAYAQDSSSNEIVMQYTSGDYAACYQKGERIIYIFNKEYFNLKDLKYEFLYFNKTREGREYNWLYDAKPIELDTSFVFHLDSALTEKEFRQTDSIFILESWKETLIRLIKSNIDIDENEIIEPLRQWKEETKLFTASYSQHYKIVSKCRQYIGYENENGEKYILIIALWEEDVIKYNHWLTKKIFDHHQYLYNLRTNRLTVNENF